jgi:DNA-binding MarR family transcriptional regulator
LRIVRPDLASGRPPAYGGGVMTKPTDDQVAALAAALDTFSRRYKLTATGPGKPLAEVDLQTLLYVKAHPDCGPTDVARFLAVPTTTISSATDRLVKRGLLERHRLEDDRRAVALSLSASGRDHVAATQRAHDAMFRMMLGRLSEQERDSFVTIMKKIAYSED